MNTTSISAKAQNISQTLQRITSLITRKDLTIIEIHVQALQNPLEFLIKLTLRAEKRDIDWFIKQITSFIDLSEITIL